VFFAVFTKLNDILKGFNHLKLFKRKEKKRSNTKYCWLNFQSMC